MISLNGHTTKSQDGITKVTFTVKGENGLETKSSAELSTDGRWLLGKSTMQIGRKPNGEPVLINYHWEGGRVN